MASTTSKPRGYVKVKVQPPVSTKKATKNTSKPSPASEKPKKQFKGDGKLKLVRFTVDCTPATDIDVMNITDFKSFLRERIESTMDTTGDNCGNFVVVKNKESKVTVTSGPPFTEKLLKSLTKKFLKRNKIKFKVILKGSHLYQLTKGISEEEKEAGDGDN